MTFRCQVPPLPGLLLKDLPCNVPLSFRLWSRVCLTPELDHSSGTTYTFEFLLRLVGFVARPLGPGCCNVSFIPSSLSTSLCQLLTVWARRLRDVGSQAGGSPPTAAASELSRAGSGALAGGLLGARGCETLARRSTCAQLPPAAWRAPGRSRCPSSESGC